MVYTKKLLSGLSILGIVAIAAAFAFHNHIARVRAARLDQVPAIAPYFPPGAIWTQDISHDPVDPNSDDMINWLEAAGGWGHGNKMQVDFAFRVLQANASTPMVHFYKGPGWTPADSDYVASIPLPVGGGIEGETGYKCTVNDSDCHLIVVDRAQGKLYEAYQANSSGSVLLAAGLVVWDLNRVYPPSGRGDQCTSTDAAGFPIAPLLFNADELAKGSINHAIRFILPHARIRAGVYVHPATHGTKTPGPPSAPPYGVHFRLKASYDMSLLSPAARVVARAMQKYGMFLADEGNIALTAQSDQDTTAKYSDVGFDSHSMFPLKVTDFEVLTLGKPIPTTDDCVRNH